MREEDRLPMHRVEAYASRPSLPGKEEMTVFMYEVRRMAQEIMSTRVIRPYSQQTGPLAYAYKELTPTFMKNHLECFERYGTVPVDESTTIHALRIALDGMHSGALTNNQKFLRHLVDVVWQEATEFCGGYPSTESADKLIKQAREEYDEAN